jgi:hypothetical protein
LIEDVEEVLVLFLGGKAVAYDFFVGISLTHSDVLVEGLTFSPNVNHAWNNDKYL